MTTPTPDPTRYVLVHLPTGTRMTATLETLLAAAGFSDVERDPDTGALRPAYDGNTEIAWDSQETVRRPGGDGTMQQVFLDEDGNEYLEGELTLMDEAAYKALEL